MTSALKGGGGSPKADKLKGGCVILTETRGEGRDQNTLLFCRRHLIIAPFCSNITVVALQAFFAMNPQNSSRDAQSNTTSFVISWPNGFRVGQISRENDSVSQTFQLLFVFKM